jgi:hypothetical protein
MIEMSSAWRDDSRGTDCSNPFSATGGHTNPITATDRVPSDEQLGKREMSVDRETQMTITRREILHRVPQRLKLTEQQSSGHWRQRLGVLAPSFGARTGAGIVGRSALMSGRQPLLGR